MNKAQLIEAILEADEGRDAKELAALKKPELEAMLEELQEVEETQAQLMSKKLREARTHYEKTIAASGNISADNGDEVAQALRTMEPKAVVTAAERILGLKKGELWAKYEGLNPGQQRMNAGNRIRGAIRRGDVDPVEALKALH